MRLLAHVTTASLIVLTLGGCTDKQLPTSMPVGGRTDAAAPPPGGGTQPPRPPIQFPKADPNDIVEITAGDFHTCARRYDFTVFCWGADANGQAGRWSYTKCSGVACVNRPTILTTISPLGASVNVQARMIDAGGNHTCMLDPASDAYCWGDGTSGQLGFAASTYGSRYGATMVTGGVKFSFISAGGQSTCGSGASGIFCWGAIANSAASPTSVTGYNTAVQLSVGAEHACIIDGSNAGIVSCWGDNQYGQLSQNPATLPSALPGTSLTTFYYSRRVTTQQFFTCVERADGQAECAGHNSSGQLGYGVTGPPVSPGQPQIVGSGKQLHGVTAGYASACALDVSDMAWCWGNGDMGQIGNGSMGQFAVFNTPQAVTGGRTYRAIAAGGHHTCAIGTDNHIYCWGDNSVGQLGTGTSGGWATTPVQALDAILVIDPFV
jgi:alpha-tubulin suppressor-like RCC1 family protein